MDSLIEARRKKTGYTLFSAKTYGDWAAVHDEYIDIVVKVSLIGGGILQCKEKLKVNSSKEELESFCPSLYEVVAKEVNLEKT